MLTAVAAIVIVSGALAFKAQKSNAFGAHVFCNTVSSATCPTQVDSYTVDFQAAVPSIVNTFCTSEPADGCQNAITIYSLD